MSDQAGEVGGTSEIGVDADLVEVIPADQVEEQDDEDEEGEG